jgi:hypothetical protein
LLCNLKRPCYDTQDLIISGDTTLQQLLNKYEKGDVKELLELIEAGYLGHASSQVDLLDGLDFDFLNNFPVGDQDNELLDDPVAAADMDKQQGQQLGLGDNNSNNYSFSGGEHCHYSFDSTNLHLQHRSIGDGHQPPPGRYRKESIDNLYISDILHDCGDLAGSMSIQGALALEQEQLDLNQLYDHFAATSGQDQGIDNSNDSGEHAHPDGIQAARQYRKTLRLDESSHMIGSVVDLSAYATLAQRLETKKPGADRQALTAAGMPGAMLASTAAATGRTRLETKSHHMQQQQQGHQVVRSSLLSTDAGPQYMQPSLYQQATQHAVCSSSMSSRGHCHGSGGGQGGYIAGNRGVHAHTGPNTAGADAPSFGADWTLPEDAKALGYIGAYSPEQRKIRITRFLNKRARRVWTKKVKYDVRKNFADSRMRIKGRFVKKEDEDIMRELLTI